MRPLLTAGATVMLVGLVPADDGAAAAPDRGCRPVGGPVWFGHLGGGLLAAAGGLGLAVTGLAAPLTASGQQLWVLEVSPAQNLVHLALGLALVVGAARSPRAARTTALVVTTALATLGLVGLALTDTAGPTTPLALGPVATALHLGLAACGAAVTLRRPRRAPPMETTAVRHP